MMTMGQWNEIRRLAAEGLSGRAVAQRVGLHRRTVQRVLGQEKPLRRAGRRRASKIDPFQGVVLAKLEQYPELSAVRIHRLLREHGFTGGYSLVKSCVSELRPSREKVYLSLKFAPGECAQVDWGFWQKIDVNGHQRRLYFFVMVQCWSRMMFVKLSLGLALEHWLECHRQAFEFFNGVPAEIWPDHTKTAVLGILPDGSPLLHPVYADFATHYGFKVRPCGRRRPNEKGRVENGVGYVKGSFFAGREPAPLPALSLALNDWLANTANVRIHGTTGRRPLDLYNETDRAALKPLPAGPYDCCFTDDVVPDCQFRLAVDGNRYSVPSQFAGKRVTLRRYADRVVFCGPDGRLIADHSRSYGRREDVLLPEHEREFLVRTRHLSEGRQVANFLTLGTAAEAFLAELQERRPRWRSHVERINALASIHGRDETARVLEDALQHHAVGAEYIQFILEARTRKTEASAPLRVTRRQDLLELSMPEPDLDIYGKETPPAHE